MNGRQLAELICAEHGIVLKQIQKSNTYRGVRAQIVYELRWLGLSLGEIARILRKDRQAIRYWFDDERRERNKVVNIERHRKNVLAKAPELAKIEKLLSMEFT